jgi:hypothetical protein
MASSSLLWANNGPPDRGEYCEIASLKKQQAHRVLRPAGHSLLMYGSNYFCFVVSPFM